VNGALVAWRPNTNTGVAPSAAVDSASYSPQLAPGGLFSIFGANLAGSTQSADSPLLPQVLADVSVSINGIPAPLLFVSATQINAQVPVEIAPGPARITVTRPNGATLW
jgi:uncharacterized protein (TIGR03437 family)